MKFKRPMTKTACVVCGEQFLAVRSKVLNGTRTCCSIRCRNVRARSFQPNTGRKPVHGGASRDHPDPIYKRWQSIKARCCYPNSNRFPFYGGRGIRLCPEWRWDYSAFRAWAVSAGYKDGLQIDRIDNDLGYSPNNCRWVTPKQNCLNRRRTVQFTGQRSTVDVAKELGMSPQSIRYRVQKMGLSEKQAATMPKLTGGHCKHFWKLIGKWKD